MYVIADGFDLGVGILFTAARSENWRDRMMFSVAPIWDGNETWLILGGGGLFAVFHLAYAILMPALYVPIIIMLIALIFRGVAFEFRFKAERSKRIWDYAFHYGSLVATFAQGIVLGAFVQGFADGRQFAGGTFDCLTPFSLLTGVSLVLRLRPSRRDLVRDEDDRRTRDLGAADGGRVPHRHDRPMASRLRLGAVPRPRDRGALVLLAQHRLSRADPAGHRLRGLPALPRPRARAPIARRSSSRSRCSCSAILGLGVSLFPYIVPPRLTIWQAANTVNSQLFALVGFLIVLPITFAYTAYAY